MSMQLDVIIPVYNEADNVQALVERLTTTLQKSSIRFNLIFVDDHSTDETVKILADLPKKNNIKILTKKGERGKAFSILEGAAASTAPFLAMIDADLQYPPEVIPEMLTLAQQHGVVVAKRNGYQDSPLRNFLSHGFQWFFGKVLHGLDCDVQSGLKVFKREIIESVPTEDVTAWTLDIPLLTTALNLGHSIGQVDISFEKRTQGESKIEFVSSIREIGGRAISYKFKPARPYTISPDKKNKMVGAGLIHRGKRFITHTTLHPSSSALDVLSRQQKVFLTSVLAVLGLFFVLEPMTTAKVVVGALSLTYFLDVIFNLYVILKSLNQPPEIDITPTELAEIKEKDLPIYTILCPLYRESHVIPHFLAAIEKFDWPKNKLDVQLLLEEDDVESIEAVQEMKLPAYVRTVVVPNSQPKTKPKACNYGLNFAKGEYVVIYDAEDSPDPQQLKKSYLAFQKVGPNIKCLQAKLNYYNPHQNWLTRLFTAEYSLWFDVILTGLQSIETTIPLGGTSNHFRTADLIELKGWDPFNVTEDCDLGVRLFNEGYKTAIIDSTTLEEANSNFKNWIRQRSRWIKGYMQTYLLHMRHPVQLAKKQGIHALLFQLTVGGKISFILINPFLWVLTVSYFALYAYVGPSIEALYPSIIFYMAVTSLIFGNFMFIYYYMIGCAKREHWGLLKWVYLIPVYWLMVSIAGFMALYELIVKPHYWQKTIHGLHLKEKQLAKKSKELAKDVTAEIVSYAEEVPTAASIVSQPSTDVTVLGILPLHNKYFSQIRAYINNFSLKRLVAYLRKPLYKSGVIFIFATLLANVINMATNFYLGKHLSFADFGLFNLMMSLFYLANIPVQAMGSTINYKSSYLLGKYKSQSLQHFWKYIHLRGLLAAVFITLIWFALSPWMPSLFNTTSSGIFLIFASVWVANFSFAINSSYLSSRLLFQQVALLALLQPFARFVAAVALASISPSLTFLAIVLSLYLVAVVSYLFARQGNDEHDSKHEFHLPRDFFVASLVSGLSAIAFFSLDNLLIAKLMGAEDVGKYAFLGLFGKMVFFIGSLSSTFLAPIVARREGASEQTRKFFYLILCSVLGMTAIGYAAFIVGPFLWGSVIFGEKMLAVQNYILLYGMGIACFTLAQVITGYHLIKRHYLFPSVALALSIVQIIGLYLFHQNLHEVTMVMALIGVIHLVTFSALHIIYPRIKTSLNNFTDFAGLFQKVLRKESTELPPDKLNILIFNWRDTKHVWAGGAEVYVHQIAKRLVQAGHSVTLFAGNDGKSQRLETVDGVQVIRRGGFYTIYFWACIYYLFRIRGRYDVVIDCENGIPFLTPLFVRKPIFLLIFHVHREVFTKHLIAPLALLARTIEELIMPFIYRDLPVLTISESSKKEITSLGISDPDLISIIHPGITLPKQKTFTKTKHPSMCYVGRLKPYKNVDVALRAFKTVLEKHPEAIFTIAGIGEWGSTLKRLAKELEIESNVVFLGKVSEQEKNELYASQWIAVQPSMIEGWGITVIEANAYGTPVIASKVKGLKDSVCDGETGILVPPGKPAELAQAIEQLFSSKTKLKAYSKSAQLWAKNFSWDNAAQKLETVLLNNLRKAHEYKGTYSMGLEK
ncbi:glycosyltransferase [Patescibacteria group bacterium]|nr:glycosyltransferase [Patescibacteria group bacterium]